MREGENGAEDPGKAGKYQRRHDFEADCCHRRIWKAAGS